MDINYSFKDRFNTQYNRVFNSDKTVKLCGRGECKKLIDIASKNDESGYYGDINTGYMNIDNINELYTKINVGV